MTRLAWTVLTFLLLLAPPLAWPETAVPASPCNALVTTFKAAFAQGDWTTAARTAREIPALDEQSYIARATALLGAQPDPV